MITIKNLSFSNMLSFGPNNIINFGERVVQLEGKNGAGKSSIPTILEELFYNKNSRGLKKSTLLNRYCGGKTYSASAEFICGYDVYTISKVVTSTASVKLIKNGKDISGHTATQTYAELEKILGVDFTTFSKLVYQSMASSLDFLSATDANRKKFLVSLLGLERYGEIQEVIKAEASDQKSVLSAAQSKHDYIIKAIANYTPLAPMTKVTVPESLEESLVTEIANLESSKLTIDKQAQVIQANNRAKIQRKDLQAKLAALPKPQLKPDQNSATYKTRYSNQVTLANAKIAEQKRIVEAKTHCPTCGTAYSTDLTHKAAEVERLDREIAELKAPLEELKNLYESAKALEAIQSVEKDLASVQVDDTLPEMPPTDSSLDKEIAQLRSELAAHRKAIKDATEHNSKVDIHNGKIQAQEEQFKQLQTDQVLSFDSLESAKVRNSRLQVLNDAFGSKGLVTYKIETMVKVFEGLINEYLQILSDGRFALEFIIEDAKLALKLYDNSSEIEIAQLSSGEFNRVNTATLLAVRKMMSAISKVNINLLFLDEVVSVLDKDGKDTLIEVLLREEGLNSVVVSHGYTHPLAAKVRVVKKNNLSSLIHDE